MSVIDLSKAVERREERDERMAWCMNVRRQNLSELWPAELRDTLAHLCE